CAVFPPHTRPQLFPYTTLFRSAAAGRNTLSINQTPGFQISISGGEGSDGVIKIKRFARGHHPVHAPASYFQVFDPVEVHLILRRSEEHTSELQSRENLVCRLLL